jgi:acyl-CoA thioesterase FadM
MRHDVFLPPGGAFTRRVPVRFSRCDSAGIVYFRHYFDMFNGLIEDWYGEELKRPRSCQKAVSRGHNW